jgi:hypothetical protein
MKWWSHFVRHWWHFVSKCVCVVKQSVTFYVFIRLCALSHTYSCDGAIFSLCAEIQWCDEKGEVWRFYWNNYTWILFILCKAMNCMDVDFSFFSNNYGNSIHIFLWFYATTKLLRTKNKTTNFKNNEKPQDKRRK